MQSADMAEDQSIPSRLKALRERAGVSVREMAKRSGMSSGGYTHYENPSRFKSDYLPLAIAKTFARALADDGILPQEVLALAQDYPIVAFSEDAPNFRDPATIDPDSALVPVYDVAASAGYGSIVDYESIAYSMAFPPDYLRRLTKANPSHLSIISVKGDSMEPTLKDDDIVMLDASKTNLAFDGMFVLRYDEALHVKRVGRSSRHGFVTIISDNRQTYPAFEIAAGDLTVVGKVIWYGRKV